MAETQIWAMGNLVGRGREKPVVARADFSSGAVLSAKLTIEHAPVSDIPDHVNLCGWPTRKEEQKAVALVLCAASQVVTPTMT